MRSFEIALIAFFALASSAVAQPSTETVNPDSSGVTQVEYVRLETVEKDHSNFFTGDRGSVGFHLVELRNLSTGQTLQGIEVVIQKQKQRATGGSLALAALGSMWGSSASVTYERIRNSGHIFLSPANLASVVAFLGDVIGATSKEHQNLKFYKVALQEGFELGMRYDPDKAVSPGNKGFKERPGWQFIVTASDASYTLDYQDGLDVVRALGGWNERISSPEGQAGD